jgi:hypothetical protein
MHSESSTRHTEFNYLCPVIMISLYTETNLAHAGLNSDHVRLHHIFSNYVVNGTIFGDKKIHLELNVYFIYNVYLKIFNVGKNSAR